jgi:phage terminase small subunit
VPTLKNPRRERFCQLLALGKCATDAYEGAGYARSNSNGPALAKTQEISARVAEITAEAFERERATAAAAAERAAITRHDLAKEALAVLSDARKAGQNAAAIAAIKEIGVLLGIRIERSERGLPGEFDWLDRLNVDELRLLAEGKLDIEAYRGSNTGA